MDVATLRITTATKLFIDYDIFVYSCAAVAEKKFYLLRNKQYAKKDELYNAIFGRKPTPKEKEQLEDEIEVLICPEPAGHARQAARALLQSILDKLAPIESYTGYLSGETNFRNEIATIAPYKGQRSTYKPTWRQVVKEFLISECNGIQIDGVEADDMLVIQAMKDPENSILCTLDKDMAQVPGLTIYDWRKKELRLIGTEEGHRNFYKQMLKGDSTDNIKGVDGMGPVGADKLLDNVKDEKLMATVVYSAYQKAYGKKAWDYFMENARLLWLLRSEENLNDPKNAFKPCITPQ